MKIPITKPIFDHAERESILKPLESGWVVQGPFVAEFEKLFSQWTRAKFARATSNCTTALHLGLEALGIGPGDRVIVPSFTYIASANAIEHTQAEAVFCDVDLKTFNIDCRQLERILAQDQAKAIKAVMPVNLFGLCADLPRIRELAEEYGLKVIEDSACGLGAYINGRHSGTFGQVGCFSFHPRKAITTGEGGMLVTDSLDLADKVNSLRDHGASKSDRQRHSQDGWLLPQFNSRGYNYRLTDIQAALGVCQMEKLEMILERRAQIASAYHKALASIEQLTTPATPPGYKHGYQSYVCLFAPARDLASLDKERIDRLNQERNKFMSALAERGIATRQGTHAVHTLGYYKKRYRLKDEDYLRSYAADRLSLALPLYAQMSDEEFNYVVSNIREVL